MPCKPHQSRDAINDIWGPRIPYKHEWPTRVDHNVTDEPDKWVQSACVLCSNGCGLDIGVKDGDVVGVRGRASDRVNKGRLGPKGLNGWNAISHPDRLKYPLIRKNGRLERSSWDEAMSTIVKRAEDIRARLTNHAISFYTSGQLFLEEYYVLAMVGKAGLHTLHMDGNTRLCTSTAAAAMRESFGADGQPGSYTDVDYTDCLFIVGHNVASTQTVLWSRMLDRLDGPDPPKLVVVDPRESYTAERATVHLAPKIGTNLALLNGIEHLLFKNGWVNEEYIAKRVVGVEALKEVVEKYTPSYVEDITGVPASQMEEAARIIGTSKSLLSTALQGVYQSNQATASACQINNINLLRGFIGKPGSGVFQMNGQPTAQNNRETGCDGEFPGFRNFQNPNHMQEIADNWNIDYFKMPHWNQPTHIENMLTYIEKGTIEMFWVSGTNPLVSLPNLPRMRDILTKPGLFVVCQDIFMTETAEIADVVLPAAQWGEKTGCFTNVDRTVHLSHKAVEPPGEAKSDMDIFVDFARRMGFKGKDGSDLIPWSTPEQVFEAWKAMSRGRPCDYSGFSYEKLTGGSGIQWPCNMDHPNGKERLFDDGVFFTDMDYCQSYGHDLETGTPFTKVQYQSISPAGRAVIKSCHYQAPMEEPNEEYPLRLSTGRNVYQFHTRTKTGRSKRLQGAYPEPFIEISEADAAAAGVKDGEKIVARSRRGMVELPAKVGKISTGQVFIPFHFGYFDAQDDRARAANELTIEQWDPISKQPMFKSGALRIEKCLDEEGTVKIHAREQQTAAVKRAQKAKHPSSELSKQTPERTRRLELWLGATHEAVEGLQDIYKTLLPRLVHDLEVHAGVRVMLRITEQVLDALRPQIDKYSESKKYGEYVSRELRSTLFPALKEGNDPYEALTTLQSMKMYLSYIEGHLIALTSASQATWDQSFIDAVGFSQSSIARQQAWVGYHIKEKSPQILLVPSVPTADLQGDQYTLARTLRG